MKTKKRRKITVAQVRATEKKLKTLQLKSAQIVKQTTPLKITIRKFIQQNMEEIEVHIVSQLNKYGILGWAIDKIKRSYFGDANLQTLSEIVCALKDAGFLGTDRKE